MLTLCSSMYKGSLRAEGTSASLKNQYGNGYTVKVDGDFEIDIPVSGPVEKEGSRHQTVYRVATPALASEVVEYLQSQGVHDYQISGPTMEELFLKATGDTLASTSTWSTTENDADASSMTEIITPTAIDDLKDGHPISVLKQWWILFGKRFRIIRRRWTPYLVAVVFAIVGAGVAPLLIKDITKPLECPTEALPISEITQRFDITSLSAISTQYMVGPPDKIRDERLAQVADLYSRNHHEHGGFQNVTDLKSLLVYVNSLDEIVQKIQVQQTNNNEGDFRSKKFQGGIWLGEEPTVLSYPGVGSAQSLVNLFNVLDSGVPISSAYKMFGTQDMPSRINFKVMVFILYYSLILAV
jgi:ATP-binding cassette subfamily A (ABC1) protein 3